MNEGLGSTQHCRCVEVGMSMSKHAVRLLLSEGVTHRLDKTTIVLTRADTKHSRRRSYGPHLEIYFISFLQRHTLSCSQQPWLFVFFNSTSTRDHLCKRFVKYHICEKIESIVLLSQETVVHETNSIPTDSTDSDKKEDRANPFHFGNLLEATEIKKKYLFVKRNCENNVYLCMRRCVNVL